MKIANQKIRALIHVLIGLTVSLDLLSLTDINTYSTAEKIFLSAFVGILSAFGAGFSWEWLCGVFFQNKFDWKDIFATACVGGSIGSILYLTIVVTPFIFWSLIAVSVAFIVNDLVSYLRSR